MSSDPFVELEVERQKLIDRGATGVSVFLHESDNVSHREVAVDMVQCMRLMNRENSRSESELFNVEI